MRPSRRDDLMESSLRVFHRSGFAQTSLDMLLTEAGVSKMTLYNHFKSKEDLIIAVLELYGERSRAKLFKFLDASSDDPEEQLLAVFDDLRSWFGEDDFAGCMFAKACGEYEDAECRVRLIAAAHGELITARFTEIAGRAGLSEPRELAEQVNLLREGAIMRARERGKRGVSDLAPLAKRAAKALIAAHKPGSVRG